MLEFIWNNDSKFALGSQLKFGGIVLDCEAVVLLLEVI